MSRNVDAVRAIHDCFNRQDWEQMTASISDRCTFTDATGMTYSGKPGMVTYSKAWADAFPDARVTDAKYYDAGDTVVTEFIGRGTHKGSLGPLAATGKTVTLPYLEIYHFDRSGKVAGGNAYFDQLGLLEQLGVAQVPSQQTITIESKSPAKT